MTYHGSGIRQPVVIGRTPKSELGALLNIVDKPPFPCPECGTDGPMGVYVPAVRWACGHTRSLPPFGRWTFASKPGHLFLIKEKAA
jgi:hypothetical protein